MKIEKKPKIVWVMTVIIRTFFFVCLSGAYFAHK